MTQNAHQESIGGKPLVLASVPLEQIVTELSYFRSKEQHAVASEVTAWSAPKSKATTRLSDFVSVSHPSGLPDGVLGYRAKFGAALLEFFRTQVLRVEWDTMSVSAIRRDDDTVLLVLSHGKIIGSHWLCLVPGAEWDAHVSKVLVP